MRTTWPKREKAAESANGAVVSYAKSTALAPGIEFPNRSGASRLPGILVFLLFFPACTPGFDAEAGIWIAETVEITSFNCPLWENPGSLDDFEIGINAVNGMWVEGQYFGLFRGCDTCEYGYGYLREDGFETEPTVYLQESTQQKSTNNIVEHHATLVDDLVLDWSYSESIVCQEFEEGGCDWWAENVPDGCSWSVHLSATWDRRHW